MEGQNQKTREIKLLEKLGFVYDYRYYEYKLDKIGIIITMEFVNDMNLSFDEFKKFLKERIEEVEKDFKLFIDERLEILK